MNAQRQLILLWLSRTATVLYLLIPNFDVCFARNCIWGSRNCCSGRWVPGRHAQSYLTIRVLQVTTAPDNGVDISPKPVREQTCPVQGLRSSSTRPNVRQDIVVQAADASLQDLAVTPFRIRFVNSP